MYLKALENGLIVFDLGVEFLSIVNLPAVISILCSKNEFSYDMCRANEIANTNTVPTSYTVCTCGNAQANEKFGMHVCKRTSKLVANA